MHLLTRRRFLRLLAAGSGVPVLSSCHSKANPPPILDIPGRIVNPSPIPAHLMRTEHTWENFPRPVGPAYDVVIVGGGVSGLCAAWKLRRAGVDRFLLLELEGELGGTSIATSSRGIVYPWGAHYINIPPAEADCVHEVLQDLGIIEGYDARGLPLIGPQHFLRWPHERLFKEEKWGLGLDPFAEADKEEREILQAFEDDMLRWTLYRGKDGRRAFAMPLLYSSSDSSVRQLDGITMADYLRSRGWKSRLLDWLVDYACRDDYGSLSTQVSAWAGIHYFACRFYDYRLREEYPADTLTWPEGNAYLVGGLSRQLEADQFRTGILVLRIEQEADGVRLGYADLDAGTSGSILSKSIIYAGKLYTAPFVVAGLPSGSRQAMSSATYSPWLVAAVHLMRPFHEAEVGMAWDNILFDSPSVGYVAANHQNTRKGSSTVLVYYLPFVEEVDIARRELLLRDQRYWSARIAQDLLAAHPDLEELIERIDIYRWGHAMMRPGPGSIWGEESLLRRRPFGGVFFASCDATGLPLFEEACFGGIRAAEQSMDHLGLSYETSLKGMPGG